MNSQKVIQSKLLPLSVLESNKGQLEGLPKNPRIIHDKNFKKLCKSIEENPEMTALREILVYQLPNKNYIIIGGNMRYEAMKSLGIESAPCKIIPAEATVEQLRKYTIKDNSGFGEWDFDLLSAEWEKDLLDSCCIEIPSFEDVKTSEEAEEDDFNVEAQLEKEPFTKFGQIWKLGDHRLVCGDSTDPKALDALMGEDMADCLITDPPYNVDYEGSGGKKIANDHMEEGQFLEFLTKAFSNADAHLKKGGSFYIWHADAKYGFREACRNINWTIRQCLIWNKNALVLGRQDYQWKHEPCLYGWKDGAGHYFSPRRDLTSVIDLASKLDIDSMSKAELQQLLHGICENLPTSVIDEDKPLRNGDHPTMKPLPLIGRLINNSTRKHELVLDIFGGSGSTLMAAEQLGRKAATIEFDPKYADVIIRRWEEFTNKQAELIGSYIKEETKGE